MVPQEEQKRAVQRQPSFLGIELNALFNMVMGEQPQPLQDMTQVTRKAIAKETSRRKSEPENDTEKQPNLHESIASSEFDLSESSHEEPNPLVSQPLSPPHDSGRRGKLKRRSSSVRFLEEVSVRQLEEVTETEKSTMYYTKADIEAFKEQQQQEEEQTKHKEQELKKQARRRLRQDRRQRIAERRASRSMDLSHLKDGLRKTTRRCTSGRNLSELSSYVNRDNTDQTALQEAEGDRNAPTLGDSVIRQSAS